MAKFEADGISYSTGKINATKQFHVFCKIAPLLSSFIKLRLASKAEIKPGQEERRAAEVGENVDQLAVSLSRMPKDDVDFVLSTTLMSCQRQVGPAWGPVWVEGGGLTDQNMPLATMLRLVWTVLEENLTSFFESAASILGSLAAKP